MLYVCICMIRCGILLIELQQKKKITLRDRVWISDTIEYDNTQNPTNGFCNERNSKASLFRTELLQLLQKPEIMHRCDEYKFDSGESVSQVYWTFDAVNRVFFVASKTTQQNSISNCTECGTPGEWHPNQNYATIALHYRISWLHALSISKLRDPIEFRIFHTNILQHPYKDSPHRNQPST